LAVGRSAAEAAPAKENRKIETAAIVFISEPRHRIAALAVPGSRKQATPAHNDSKVHIAFANDTRSMRDFPHERGRRVRFCADRAAAITTRGACIKQVPQRQEE
jgi:hypothetical protein